MADIQITDMTSTTSFPDTAVIAIEDNGSTYKLTGASLAAALKTIGSLLSTSDLKANLTTSTAGSPLDATQGKALADMLSGLISSTSIGSYTDLTTAAAGVWDSMSNETVKVGRFLRTGVSYYLFVAYRNSANYASMLCWSYGAFKLYMINKVQGTIQTPAEFVPAT